MSFRLSINKLKEHTVLIYTLILHYLEYIAERCIEIQTEIQHRTVMFLTVENTDDIVVVQPLYIFNL